ncbi:MAG: Uma2 family endonuclease [Salinibacter sp.]
MPSIQDPATEHQKRWERLSRDPSLNDLPYKVETNRQAQLILTPISVSRSLRMSEIMQALDEHAPDGSAPPSYALATSEGVKVPDVVWYSPERGRRMRATGDPSTLAPEICVEVMSDSNTEGEMQAKRGLYREVGAEEVWVVRHDGTIQFFGDDEREQSEIAPESPKQVEV